VTVEGGWGGNAFVSERVVDNHIGSLRRKIEPDPDRPRYLKKGSPQKTDLAFRPIEPFTVSPDGTQIAMVGGHKESEIWVMTGLLKETKPTPKK
jgi:hypothetical protein